MNKAIIRRAAVILTAVSLTAVPVFAKSNKGNMRGPDDDNERFEMQCKPGKMMGMFGGPESKQTMGTVSSIDTSSGMVSVTDVDGNAFQIHISPATRLVKDTAKGPAEATIDDIKKDSWVMVASFNTNTKTLEAARIFVENK